MTVEKEIATLQSELMRAIRGPDRQACEGLLAANFSLMRAHTTTRSK
jgi:hypothetical protein